MLALVLQDAIAKGSFHEPVNGEVVEAGDINSGFQAADVIVSGQLSIGGQQHFYLEPPVCFFADN